jgi:hypothetical protein
MSAGDGKRSWDHRPTRFDSLIERDFPRPASFPEAQEVCRTGSGTKSVQTNLRSIAMFFFQEGFTYRNFLMDVVAIFAFVVWFWLLVVSFSDLFRRHDISGWGKALWVIGLLLFSYLGVLAYLITQGRGMAERNAQQAQQAREDLRRVVGYSVADEITKLDQLKKSGSLSDAEFQRLRAKLV